MADPTVPVDKLVAAYRKIRDRVKFEEDAHEARVAALKEQQELISAELLRLCNDQNVDSLRTAAGTVTRTVTTRYWTSDWESMYAFIREHGAMQLLEQRIHNGNMKQFLEENPEELPVGLNAASRYSISVRKPTTK